jgi:hypothetical protein
VKHIGNDLLTWAIYFTVFGLPFVTRPAAFSGAGRQSTRLARSTPARRLAVVRTDFHSRWLARLLSPRPHRSMSIVENSAHHGHFIDIPEDATGSNGK